MFYEAKYPDPGVFVCFSSIRPGSVGLVERNDRGINCYSCGYAFVRSGVGGGGRLRGADVEGDDNRGRSQRQRLGHVENPGWRSEFDAELFEPDGRSGIVCRHCYGRQYALYNL